MRNKWIYAFIVSCALNSALGSSDVAAQSEPIALPLRVEAGQTKRISYDRVKVARGEGKETVTKGHIEAVLKILSVNDESIRATWTTNTASVGDEILDKSNPKAAEYLIGTPLEFIAGLDAAPIEVVNAQSTLDSVFNSPPLKAADANATQSAKALLSGMSASSLAQFMLKAPTYMSLCHGTSLIPGEMREFETELANPFGGDSFPAKGYYLLSEPENGAGVAKIIWRQAIDPTVGKKGLLDGLKKLVENADSSTEGFKELEKMPLDMRYEADCTVDTTDGWVETMNYKITLSLGIAESEDTWQIQVRD